jgi:hypothetical protein
LGVAPAEAAPGEVQTEPAEATAGGYLLKGRLNPEGSPTSYYFIYKDTGLECENEFGCGPETPVGGPLTGDTQQEVPPIEVTGLDPGRTYRYWLIAWNAHGMERGEELTFTTPAATAPSEVQTEPAEATANGFKLRGRLNPEGLPTTYYFVYSEHNGVQCESLPGCGLATAIGGPLTGDAQQEVPPLEVTGLTPGKTYSYWLTARNAKGTAYGQELIFTVGTSTPTMTPYNAKVEVVINLVSPLGIAGGSAAKSPSGGSSPSGATLKPTVAKHQKLVAALKVCQKKPRSRRPACEKRAHEKYGIAARKSR